LIQFNFNTAELAQGIYTANVTVYAPGAVDSPQSVIATALVGDNPGAAADSYLTPGVVIIGYSCGFDLSPPTVNTQDGGTWLTVAAESEGTFGFDYYIDLAPPLTMAPTNYTGKVACGQTANVPVTMHLTAQPLAVPAPGQIAMTVVQGGPPLAYPFLPAISLNPAGAIVATSVTASGAGISASLLGGNVAVTVDPGSLQPGPINGSVTIGCGAASCPVVVPVSLTVSSPGPPVITGCGLFPGSGVCDFSLGVFDNVTFTSGPFAPGEVLVVRGVGLSDAPPAYANGPPLPTTLGGALVLFNGTPAPLYYSSSNQIAFQLPSATSTSQPNQIQVRDGQSSAFVTVQVQPHAPQIAAITDAAYNPLDAYHSAQAGDTIIVWAIGLGATNPAVPDGTAAPSNTLAIASAVPAVQFGSSPAVNPSFAGLSPGTVGLYQINVTIPAALSGNLAVKLVYPDAVSNAVPIAIR